MVHCVEILLVLLIRYRGLKTPDVSQSSTMVFINCMLLFIVVPIRDIEI